MNTNYIRHRDGSIEFISVPGAHSAPSAAAAAISAPVGAIRRTAYSWYECAAAYWIVTLILAGGMGTVAGFWLLRRVCIMFAGSGIAGAVFFLGPYLVIIAFLVGALVYNLKCANRYLGVFEGSNYALSLLTATGFGAAVIPVVIIACAVIAAILALLAVVAIIAIIIAIFSS